MNSTPKLIPKPILSIDMVIPSIKEIYRIEGKDKEQINEIMAENMPEFEAHYISEAKRDYHTPDVNSVYKAYEEYVTPRINLIQSLNTMARNKNYNVYQAGVNSGSNSDEQVNASSVGSNARTRKDRLLGEIQRKEEEYKQELKAAHMTCAKELYRFINLAILTKGGRRRKTRKLTRLRKTRRLRRKA